MKNKIEDVIDQISEDVLTEDTKKMLSEAFAEAVETTISDRLELEVSNALQQLDEEHSTKLEQLLEAIDTDHSNKLIAVMEKIDKDHTEKLGYLIKTHQVALNEDATEFKQNLLTQLSKYMEVYIEKAIPAEELQEAVDNKKAYKIVQSIKQMVSLDDEFINDTIKEAVEDGRKTIDSLKTDLNEAIKQNIQITQGLKAKNAELVLEKNIADLDKNKKDYVLRMLKGKDPDYITENFDYVVNMFDKEEDESSQLISEEAKQTSKVVSANIDTPRKEEDSLISESTEKDSAVVDYMSAMERQDRFKS